MATSDPADVAAWLYEHYEQTLCEVAPLGFVESAKLLELRCRLARPVSVSGKGNYDIALRVVPAMPGMRARYGLTVPTAVEGRDVQSIAHSYDDWEECRKDIFAILEADERAAKN